MIDPDRLVSCVEEQVRTRLPCGVESACCVGLSGGNDSVVLLDLLAQVRARCPRLMLRAVHVDHRLDPASPERASHAVRSAEGCDVPCEVVEVRVDGAPADGLEAAARRARYRAFAQQLRDGEILVTAHHADDQLETVLFALVRGSGPAGLAGMPALKPFARGSHWRPLLERTRTELEEYARARNLRAAADPANEDLRHDRNYLRREVVPKLRDRWPAAAASAVRSARHLSDVRGLLDEYALIGLLEVCRGECVDLTRLGALSDAQRRNVLRYWLHARQVFPPTERRLRALERDLAVAARDRNPVIRWPDVDLHRYRGRLYAVRRPRHPQPMPQSIDWPRDETLVLPEPLGRLRFVPDPAGAFDPVRLPVRLEVRFRDQANARVRLAGRTHTSSLGEVLRGCGVLPWMRDSTPLVWAQGALIAIGDRAVAPCAPEAGGTRLALEWEGAPDWRAGS